MSDQLAPYLPELQAAAVQAVRAAIELPEAISLSLRPLRQTGDAPAGVTVMVGDATPLAFDLLLPPTDSPQPLASRWHQVPRDDAALQRIRRGVQARIERGGPPIAALQQRLAAWLVHGGRDDEVFRKVSDSAFGRYGLLRLGFACNQRCGFCWQGRDWPAPPPALYHQWLDEMAALGVRNLLVTGGEPTLWPDLAALIRRASADHGMRVLLETNAIRVGQPHVRAALWQAGLRTLFVSYHSSDAATSDRLTKAPGTHRRTEQGAAAWLGDGGEVQLNCVVQPDNVAQLAAHAEAIVARFVVPHPEGRVSLVTYTQPAPYEDRVAFAEALVPLDEVRPGLLAAVRTLLAAGVEVQVDGSCGFPTCIVAEAPAAMRWQPDLELAESDRQSRSYAACCDRCAARPGCLGVRREYLERFGDRGLQPMTAPPLGAA